MEKAEELLGKQKYCVAAIITDRQGKVLSIGQNSYEKTHPTQAMWAQLVERSEKVYLHAEMESIIKNKNSHRGVFMYVARVRVKDGRMGLAKPCKTCTVAILKGSNVERVYYTTNEQTIEYYDIPR